MQKMQKKEIPCKTGEACASCWNNDTCQLYKYRKKEQQEKAQIEKERLENEESEQIEKSNQKE